MDVSEAGSVATDEVRAFAGGLLVHPPAGAAVLGEPVLFDVAFASQMGAADRDAGRGYLSADAGAALWTLRQFRLAQFLQLIESGTAAFATFGDGAGLRSAALRPPSSVDRGQLR